MKKLLTAIALGALAFTGIGCSCSLADCFDGATVVVHNFTAATFAADAKYPVGVQVCIESTCENLSIVKQSGFDHCDSTSEDTFCNVDEHGDLSFSVTNLLSEDPTISVEVTDASGVTIYKDSQEIKTHDNQPNGAMCGPTCRYNNAELTIGVK